VVVPFLNGEKCGEAIRKAVAVRAHHIRSADLDGDGTDEIMWASYGPPSTIVIFRVGSTVEEIQRLEFPAKFVYAQTGDHDGDSMEEFVLVFGEYSGWQAWQIRTRDEGGPLEFTQLSPYRFLGPITETISVGENRYVWICSGGGGDDKRILRGMTEHRYILDGGFYRLTPESEDPPVDFSPVLDGRNQWVRDARGVPEHGMIVGRVYLPGKGVALAVGSLDEGRRWALHEVDAKVPLGVPFVLDADEDPALELVTVVGEKLRAWGTGDPREPDKEVLFGTDTQAADLQRLDNPFLATGLELASMEWHEEALGLFEKAREGAVSLLEERRALLGEADCLVRLGRTEEAMALYRKLVGSSAAGIAEELFSIVELLRKEGKWKEIYDLLSECRGRISLPKEMDRWASEVQANVEPLTRMDNRIAFLPVKEFDPSYICDHPMKARKDEDSGAVVFLSDATRRACFGRLIEFHGGPLRIEATVEVQSLQWAAYLYLGLFRIREKMKDTLSSAGIWLYAQTGRCTDVPAVMLSVPGVTGWNVQEFPPGLPTVYTFELTYAPSMNHLTFTIRDETRDKVWETGRKYSSKLAPGKYCLALAGGSGHASTMFQTRIEVRRFELVTTSKNDKPIPWEPTPGAFTVARANAALSLGDSDKALALLEDFDVKTPEFHEECSITYWDRSDTDPGAAAKVDLIRALAQLRTGKHDAFFEAFSDAMEKDPARVFGAVSAGFPSLNTDERNHLGAALRKILLSPDNTAADRMADTFEKDASMRPRFLNQAPEQYRAALANALRGIQRAPTPEFAEQALAGFFSMWAELMPSLLEAVFHSTALEERAHRHRLIMEARNFQHCGAWANARKP
ncbi:MAG: FG-GAP repeat domain-containing protein, partial [Planctomycetota bacterium]